MVANHTVKDDLFIVEKPRGWAEAWLGRHQLVHAKRGVLARLHALRKEIARKCSRTPTGCTVYVGSVEVGKRIRRSSRPSRVC